MRLKVFFPIYFLAAIDLSSASLFKCTDTISFADVKMFKDRNKSKTEQSVDIHSTYTTVKGDSTYTNFDIFVTAPDSYFLSFWMYPTKTIDNEFLTYKVLIDGVIVGYIFPHKGDWQSISVDGNKSVYITKGSHLLSVVSTAPEIPSVEYVKFSNRREDSYISERSYVEYKNAIKEKSETLAVKNAEDLIIYADSIKGLSNRNVSRIFVGEQNNPPYDSSFRISKTVYYTFYKRLLLYPGDTISVTTNKINNFSHVIEVFSHGHPNEYTWVKSTDSNSNTTSLVINVPTTDIYYIRVRSLINDASGFCNIQINNTVYEAVPLYSFGIRQFGNKTSTYNSFTGYNDGDPYMWLEAGPTIPGKIMAYNDDFNYSEFYGWGWNSRIKRVHTYFENAIHTTCYSSNIPSCTCDIYSNFISSYESDGNDFIQSSPGSSLYNCVSWAGGIYTQWFWPPEDFSMYGTDALSCFDYFFGTERYPGCSIYTRVGANESNSCIDLWGVQNVDGSIEYKHTSIRKGADSNAHGYAWESKCGELNRIYHPRIKLPNLFSHWGSIVAHYRKVDNAYSGISLEESISDGRCVIKTVRLTEEEIQLINQKVSSFTEEETDSFNSLYGKWESVWNKSPYSNPADIADCEEYRNLLLFCLRKTNSEFLVFKKTNEGSLCSICLVKDLTLQKNRQLFDKIKNIISAENHTKEGMKIIHTIHSNVMTYIKEYIKSKNNAFQFYGSNKLSNGISYSNTDRFEITSSDKSITLQYSLESEKRISLDVIDLKGNVILIFVKNKLLPPNNYSFQSNILPGTYLVRFIVDGNLNVKKIYVQ